MSDPHRLVPFEIDTSIYDPPADALEFLHETISKDDEELKRIVFNVQREAYAIHPFPCILRFGFLSLRAYEHPKYQTVIESAKNDADGGVLLDVGCCMGTDLRKLVCDGFPASRAIGTDIYPAFFDLGHKLWNDASSCGIKFIEGNVFSLPLPSPSPPSSSPTLESNSAVKTLDDLRGKTKYIYTGAVFHLFDEKMQEDMARKIAGLASWEVKGTMLWGMHVGAEEKGLNYDPWMESKQMFCHNTTSWIELWTTILTDLLGAEYVKEHIRIEAELTRRGAEKVDYSSTGNDAQGDAHVKAEKGAPRLVWSVSVV